MIFPHKIYEAKVTVVVVAWNCERFLYKCLSSLQEQSIPPYEIIVVDNASRDRSINVLEQFSSVRVLAQAENLGFSRANNLAIRLANPASDWIALVNPDAYVNPNWLEQLLHAAKLNPDFDVFGSQLVKAENPLISDGRGDVYHISGLVWRAGHGELKISPSEDVKEIFSPCAAAALYRRDAIEKLDGFDEDYFCYVEDVDLGFRLRLAGHRCLNVPTSIAHHVGSGTTGSQHSDFAIYHGHRNLVWTYIKNMPGRLFWIFLPLHLLMNLVSILALTLRGQGRVILRAKRDALLGLPRMWKKRKVLQQKRVATVSDIWRVLDKRIITQKK